MHLRAFALAGALLLLAACSSKPEPAPGGPGGPVGPGGPGGALAVRPGVAAGSGGDRRRPRVLRLRPAPTSRPRRSRSCSARREWLKRYPNVSVTIEGHTDERGTREYNLALGERRAQAVKNVLVALGIPASRISTISYGKERPEVPHSTEQSYAQNRRGVTVVN